MTDKELIEELQAENDRLKQQYESTPQRALKSVFCNFGISTYSLAGITFFDADLNVIFSHVKNELTADDIKEDK